jgi:protein-tyrosine kinase
MSIIERSLQKLASGRAAAPQGPERKAPHQSKRSSAAEVAAARQYRRVTMNSVALEANKVLRDASDPHATAAYNIVRTRLLQRLAANNWSSVAVTGSQPGEGKSLTAINLALALARDENTWVFLVDMDLKRPSIARQLGLEIDRDLSDYLSDTAKIDDIIYDPGIPRLAVIPNCHASEQPSELLGSARMDALVEHLKADKPRRVIIYDMPPLMVSDDVLTFAPRVDGLLLVVAEGTTDRKTLEAARQVLSEMNLIGVVLNRSSSRDQRGYSYY